ncbi:MaoC/PaaZ C-terminal domain-containing protein [Kitasatospora sp. NPDC093102]|uniref:MaoC family dehydratase n=1 Tax=Kitasatospora sp. NPDC093102 TaxID=3155069 RepID=UPI0034332991
MNDRSTSEAADFDPEAFLVVPARTFEDLRIGEVFRAPSRTLTDAHAAAFQTVSADNHPVHYDIEWARRHGHPAPVVHRVGVRLVAAAGAVEGGGLATEGLRLRATLRS